MYRPTREETEAAIEKLAELCPKRFFINPRDRVPLSQKHHHRFADTTARLWHRSCCTPPLDWYTSHLGYLYALEAGAKRVGIKGEVVGTVTETEARQAKSLGPRKKARDKARREAQQAPPIVEVVKRADAIKEPTPMPKTVKPIDAPPVSSDPLAGVQALIDGVRAAMTASPPALRAPLAKAGLTVVAAEIQKVIAGLDREAA